MRKENPEILCRAFDLYDNKSIFPRDPDPLRGQRWDIMKSGEWPINLENGEYFYVVTKRGFLRISLCPYTVQKTFTHAELAKNETVYAAGTFLLKKNAVALITNKSGHYQPAPDSLSLVMVLCDAYDIPLYQDCRIIQYTY